MDLFVNSLEKAYGLIVGTSINVWSPLFMTLQITSGAILISVLIGLPIGMYIGLNTFRGRQILFSFINTAMGLPPVVVGLFVSLLLWRSGVLGQLGLMYSSAAMVIAEVTIALPLVIGLTAVAVQNLDPKMKQQIISLGASRTELYKKILFETKIAVFAAVIAGFGAVVSEVGAAIMVGGNIEGQTRVLTTAIVLETRNGNFSTAVALSLILLMLTLLINSVLTRFQQKDGIHWNRIWH